MTFAAFSMAALGLFASFAAADTISPNPITFNSDQGYHPGNINGQQGWSNTGSYDANVVSTSLYGFGDQALQISDAVATGSFGDQTFSPGLSSPAGESPAQTHFDASFQIGTAVAGEQAGLHMSVSPDNGSGGRMSYLRFEDQADGVHVFFEDATDPGPYYTEAAFTDTPIATLDRSSAHTMRFSIDFRSGPANDVVKIYVDGTLKATGTTWEDYYRYDNEGQGAGQVPLVSKLLFREGGTANPANLGKGFLVDGVSLASSLTCKPTGFSRDGIDLTAAQIGGTVTGTLDATGCNIGAYNPTSVTGADIFGANYFGVVDDGIATNVTSSTIHRIGEVPFNGAQHGVAIYYTGATASGTISHNAVSKYQKNGISVTNGATALVDTNTVTGEGPVNYIAQNGIQISYGASVTVKGNTVSGNWYTGPTVTACGLLFYQASGVKQSANTLFANQTNFCNFGRGGGNTRP
jgi:hypothetical protein